MALEPLTSAGIQQKQMDLYALGNPALIAEANSIRSNFITWINANFVVNSAQLIYLNSMPSAWIDYAASETAMAVEHRLPITFSAPNPLPAPSISKMTKIESMLNASYSQASGFSVSGSVAFTLSY
jgi:hypothetical protein